MNISPRKTINVADNHMKKVFSILHTRKCKPKPSWIQLNMHKEREEGEVYKRERKEYVSKR